MALSLAERVSLAQALWQSINSDLPDGDEPAASDEAIHRDQELSSGKVTGRSHDAVMKARLDARNFIITLPKPNSSKQLSSTSIVFLVLASSFSTLLIRLSL